MKPKKSLRVVSAFGLDHAAHCGFWRNRPCSCLPIKVTLVGKRFYREVTRPKPADDRTDAQDNRFYLG